MRQGVNLQNLIAESLMLAGVGEAAADKVAARVIAEVAQCETLRDDAGRVWAQLPVFGEDGDVLPFDARNVAALEQTAAHILFTSPEPVAVFGGVVYPSRLREAKISRVVWMGRAGEVVAIPDIFNSLDAIALLHQGMFIRLEQRKAFEQNQIAILLAQKKDAYESAHGPGRPEAAPEGQEARQEGTAEGKGRGGPPGAKGD